MIEYIKYIFTVPTYKLSAVDQLAMCGIILAGIFMIALLVLFIWCIYKLIANIIEKAKVAKAKKFIKEYEERENNNGR